MSYTIHMSKNNQTETIYNDSTEAGNANMYIQNSKDLQKNKIKREG